MKKLIDRKHATMTTAISHDRNASSLVSNRRSSKIMSPNERDSAPKLPLSPPKHQRMDSPRKS